MLEDIREGRNAAMRVLGEYADAPESFSRSLLGPQAINRYFQYYFFERRSLMDYPVSGARDDTLLSMLSVNGHAVAEYRRRNHQEHPHCYWRQSFASAAGLFKAIDAPTQGVVVPYRSGGQAMIADLCSANSADLPRLLHRAQRYSVNVFAHVLDRLQRADALYEAQEGTGVLCLRPGYYSDEFGLSTESVSDMGFLNA